jgi:hypothetical protein
MGLKELKYTRSYTHNLLKQTRPVPTAPNSLLYRGLKQAILVCEES